MKATVLALAFILSAPAVAQLTNPSSGGTVDQTARDAAAAAAAAAAASAGSVKMVAGNSPDQTGNVALPTSFSGISMSNTTFTGSTLLNGAQIVTATDILNEATARNAAITSAISAYVAPVTSVNGLTGAVAVPTYSDAQSIAANAAAVAAAAAKAAAASLDVIQVAAPASGATVTTAANTTILFINNPALLATLTVALPASPVDGQRFTVAANGTITAMSFTGSTAKGLLTTLSANGYARYVYSAALTSWFRVG